MRYLLDTSVFLWYVSEHPKLGSHLISIIGDRRNTVHLSIVSIWEAAIKFNVGKLDLVTPPFSAWIDRELAANSFDLLEITIPHLKQYADLPLHHRDPFDRLLIAQSIVEDIPVLSGDASFDHYPVQRVW